MQLHRSSGVLMHVSSLYGSDSIGGFGQEAREFIDFLADCGFGWWQVLPFCMSDEYNSPYKSFSAFGGNPYFVDIRRLREEGLLSAAEVEAVRETTPFSAEYGYLYRTRLDLLRRAAERTDAAERARVAAFLTDNPYLAQFCDFMARRRANGDLPWYRWQDAAARDEQEYEAWGFIQYRFMSQWQAIHDYAAHRGVKILGDMPIYVSYDSCDVFANREQFLLDAAGAPTAVAGCPPDYFARDGQLWGNPLYDWKRMEQDGYVWWRARMRHMLSVFDGVRIDHFRGFESYWSIPADARTAREGHWEPGPGMPLVQALRDVAADIRTATGREVTVLAEDLGESTEALRQFVKDSGFPGMRVMQFAFDGDPRQHPPALQLRPELRRLHRNARQQYTARFHLGGRSHHPAPYPALLRVYRNRLELPGSVPCRHTHVACFHCRTGCPADTGYPRLRCGHAHERPRQSRGQLVLPHHARPARRHRPGVLSGTQSAVRAISKRPDYNT